MSFKFSTGEQLSVLRMAEDLNALREAIEASIDVYNSKAAQLLAPVIDAHKAYNKRLNEAEQQIGLMLAEKSADYNAEPEKWKDGPIGAVVAEWLDSWDELEYVAVEIPEHEEMQFEFADEEMLPDELPRMVFEPALPSPYTSPSDDVWAI
jgi:hypothetical protein